MSDQNPSSSSDESNKRKQLQRRVKGNVNYKETRTYNRRQIDEDIDITRKSTVTSRTPPSQRKEVRQSIETESDAEYADATLGKHIDSGKHSTPTQNSPVGADSDEDSEYADDLLSSKIDKNNTLHLKTPIKAENVSRAEYQQDQITPEDENQDENIQASNRSNSEFEEFLEEGSGPMNEQGPAEQRDTHDRREQAQAELNSNIQRQLMLYDVGNNIHRNNPDRVNEGGQEIVNFEPQPARLPAIMADMWLKMAKLAPEISSSDSSDRIYEAVDKLRQIGKLVPIDQWQLFVKQICAKFDSTVRKSVTKEIDNLTDNDKLCDYLEEKFVQKGSYLKNLEEI